MTDEDKGSVSTQRRYATSLASFVPESVKRYIMKVVEHNGELKVPQSQSFETVALFADVSGFTALTDLLAKKGPLGAEEIGFYLNRYLEQLVKIIARSGGDVFKFAGDAIVVLWPSEQDSLSPTDLADMVHRAASCSLNIQTELHNAALEQHVTMSLKLGIGVGRVAILHVGGVHGRIEFLAAGAPLMQAFRAEHKASAGDAIMSIEAWQLVESKFTGEQIDEYNVRLKGCKHAIRNISVRRTPLQWNKGSMDLLQAYVPAAVLPYLKINQKLWSAELRQVSVIFINLGFKLEDFDKPDGIAGPLDLVQRVVSAIQEATYRYEGSLNKFLVDDKGSTLLVVFGLPPLAHENDPTRAVLASLTILAAMNKMNLKCKIGVTSGLALCGLVGSGSRREYSVLGDLVNLSARLMQASDCNVLCDNATFLATRNQRRLQFTTPSPIHVKGKTETVVVHQPQLATRLERYQPAPKCKITVGLKSEISRFSSRINEFLSESGEGFVACITGEIGVGKTHLLRHVSFQYSEKLAVIWGRADPFSSMKSIQIFQSFFLGLVSILLSPESDHQQLSPADILVNANRPDLIPILDVINPFEADGTRRCSQPPLQRTLSYIDDDDLSTKILDVIVIIIQAVAVSRRKILLIFDECQWIGQDSWEVLGSLTSMVQSKQLNSISIMIGTRPLHHEKYQPLWDEIPSQYLELSSSPSSNNVVLDNLGMSETKELIESKTNGFEADLQLISLIYERTGGRPLFCIKFMDALLAVNALVMEDKCQLSAEWRTRGEWDTELPIPYRIQRITACQLDRLTPSQTMLLKTAAVICIAQGEGALRFNLGMIRITNPIHEYISSISSDIQALIKFGVVFEEPGVQGDQVSPSVASTNAANDASPGSGDEVRNELIPIEFDEEMNHEPILYTKNDASADAKTYRFSYGFVRDFLYQIMLYKQRQKLHRICCDYIQAHLHESEDVDQEQMVLSRHIILSGANSTQFDEYLSAIGTRKSTIIPSRVSASRISRSSFNMSPNSKWATQTPDLTMTANVVPVTKTRQSPFKKIFCCFAERRPKIDSLQAGRSGLPTIMSNIDPGSITTAGEDEQPQPNLKVSLSAFSEMRVPGEDAVEKRDTPSSEDKLMEGYRHQRASIGILQELHQNPALRPADRERIEYVMNAMANFVPISEFTALSQPTSVSVPVIEESPHSEKKSSVIEPKFSLSLKTLPNTPRTNREFLFHADVHS